MAPRSFSAIALLLSPILVLIAAPRAAAEDEEKRFTWHPSIQVTTVADDQPYLEKNSKAAVGAWVSPKLELGYRAESYELGAELGADLRRYLGEESLSEDYIRVGLWGEVGILPGLTVRMADGYAPRPERISAPGDATSNLLQTNQFDTEIRYWRELSGQREVLLSLRGSHFTGERFDAELLTDGGGVVMHDGFRPDHWEGAASLEIQSPIAERTAVYIRSQLRYRTFSESSVTDHGEMTTLVGLRTRRFHNVEIDLAAGWGVISFDSRDNVQRFVGEGSLRYRLPSGWTWRLSTANRFVADVSGNNFVETTGRMGIQKYFGELTSLSAAAFLSRLENDAWGTDKNLFGGAEFRVRRRIGAHTDLSLTYRYWRNAGDYSFDDFSQNRLAIQLSYRR